MVLFWEPPWKGRALMFVKIHFMLHLNCLKFVFNFVLFITYWSFGWSRTKNSPTCSTLFPDIGAQTRQPPTACTRNLRTSSLMSARGWPESNWRPDSEGCGSIVVGTNTFQKIFIKTFNVLLNELKQINDGLKSTDILLTNGAPRASLFPTKVAWKDFSSCF